MPHSLHGITSGITLDVARMMANLLKALRPPAAPYPTYGQALNLAVKLEVFGEQSLE
jgi:hypothetical protein